VDRREPPNLQFVYPKGRKVHVDEELQAEEIETSSSSIRHAA
jgi:hypothetical protein